MSACTKTRSAAAFLLVGSIGTAATAQIDGTSGLPASASTTENDPHRGRIENRIDFSDWRDVGGIPLPFRLEQFTGDKLVRREIRTAVSVHSEHADGMIAAYVPDEKPLFNADLLSPNRPLQFSLRFDDPMHAIDWHGIDVEKHAGGHGSGIPAHPVDVTGHTMPVIRQLETGAN